MYCRAIEYLPMDLSQLNSKLLVTKLHSQFHCICRCMDSYYIYSPVIIAGQCKGLVKLALLVDRRLSMYVQVNFMIWLCKPHLPS